MRYIVFFPVGRAFKETGGTKDPFMGRRRGPVPVAFRYPTREEAAEDLAYFVAQFPEERSVARGEVIPIPDEARIDYGFTGEEALCSSCEAVIDGNHGHLRPEGEGGPVWHLLCWQHDHEER